MFSADRIA